MGIEPLKHGSVTFAAYFFARMAGWRSHLTMPSQTLPVLRVNQLDALRLDSEIVALLRQQLADVFSWHTEIIEHLQPEVDALLRAFFWRLSVWVDGPTPGGRLQNVVHSRADATGAAFRPLAFSQKASLFFITVLAPWLTARLHSLAQAFDRNGGNAQALAAWYLRRLEPRVQQAHGLCSLLNLLVFLRFGVFSAIVNRLLGIRLVHIDPSAKRQVALQYMNRVMMWNALSEFLITAMPQVNLVRLRQVLTRHLLPKSMVRSMEVVAEKQCGLCDSPNMTIPVRADCGHVFCYFCLASEKMEGSFGGELKCPWCSATIQSFDHAV